MRSFKKLVLALALVSFTSLNARADLQQGAAAAAQAAIPIALLAASSSGGFATAMSHPCTVGHMGACVLMGLSIAQVALALLQKNGSSKSASDLTGSGGGNSVGSEGVTNADPSSTYTLADGTVVTGKTAETANALQANGLGAIADQYVKDAQTAANSGVSVSDDGSTVTTPSGQKIASSSLGTTAGMKAAGFSDSDIQAIQDATANANKIIAANNSKIAALTNDVSGGGGGSGGLGGAGGSGGSGSSGDDALSKMRAAALNKNKANVSGMSKKMGNDNIGVAGDDIFEMISRRYQTRDKINSFIKN